MDDVNSLRARAAEAMRRTLRLPKIPSRVPPNSAEAEKLRRVEAAIGSMDEPTRQIFMAHRFEDLSYARIARRLGVGIDDVERHMAKALMHLWRALKDDLQRNDPRT